MRIGACSGYKLVYSLFFALLLSLLAIAGCGGAASSGPGTSQKVLVSIAASPVTADISVGASEQFHATATYSDNSTEDVTAAATWADANAKVATITPAGMATALAAGSTTVTATMDGVSGNATLTVPAVAKTVTSIAVTPATPSILAGATQQFVATATYSDSSTANVTTSATWTSSSTAVATVTPAGLASGVTAGSATITATLSGVAGTSSLTVQAPAVVVKSIAVTPGTASIVAKTTQPFAATATYSDGTTADVTANATWTTSNPAIATVSAGIASGVAAGTTTVTASLSGINGIATLTVTPSLTSISVTPSPVTLVAGTTQQFTATANYSDGSTHNVTATAQWSAANTAVATVNAAGVATAVATGSTAVTATFNGTSGSATLNVKTLTSIAVTPGSPTFNTGSTEQFTATATYSDSSTQNVTSTAKWSVGNTAVATINAAGLATGVASGSSSVTAALGSISGTTTFTVAVPSSIAVTPNPASFNVGSTQQFTATLTNGSGTTDITATATWSVVNTAVATVNSAGLATGVAAGSTTITAALNGTSGKASFTVTLPTPQGVNIPTWHVDNNRSGLNPYETTLTPANVAPQTFGKLFTYLVDGYAYAEPLLMSNVTINGSVHNVLYIATENDSVYAFDADSYGTGANAGKPLWQVSLLNSGETPLTGASVQPVQGVTSTPVIDPSSNTIYVVSAQKSSANGPSYRLNALDITTGLPKQSAATITASVQGTNSTAVNGTVSLPAGCVQRAALLLANSTIYIGVGSCHSGWLLSYNAQTLAQTGVFNASPNMDGEGTYGGAGGVWMGSGGPVADSAGNVYISTGNGPWNPSKGSYGDSILKFSPSLQLLDYFTPEDFGFMNCNDSDLAAGGLLMIPGSGQVVGGGKMGRIYLLNTAQMGHEQALDAGVVQRLFVEQGVSSSQPYSTSCTDSDSHGNPLPNGKTWYVGGPSDTNGDTSNGVNSYEIFGTSAYFNGSIYLGVTPTSTTNPTGVVRRFTYTSGSTSATGTLAAEESTSLNIAQQQPENTRGTTPFISANGTSNGILWAIDQGQPLQSPQATTNATLYAYDATNLSNELYGSDVNSGDQPGIGIKFSSPIVANGKVYISTGHDPVSATNPQGEIDVYGLK